MKKKRSQISLEFILLLSIIILFLSVSFFYSITSSRQKVKDNLIEENLAKIKSAADTLNALGPGNSRELRLNFPAGIKEFSTDGDEIYFIVSKDGGDSYIETYTQGNIFQRTYPIKAGLNVFQMNVTEDNIIIMCMSSCYDVECGLSCGMDCGNCSDGKTCYLSHCICSAGTDDCDNDGTCECDTTGDNECVSGSCLDAVPDNFEFTDLYDQEVNSSIYSENLILTGFTTLTATVSGEGNPNIRCNGGAWLGSCEINSGEILQVMLTTEAGFDTTYAVTVTVGNLEDIWIVRTKSNEYECGDLVQVTDYFLDGTFENVQLDGSDLILESSFEEVMIDYSEGIKTTSANLRTSAWYDGDITQTTDEATGIQSVTSMYMQNDWGSGNEKNISKVIVYPSTDSQGYSQQDNPPTLQIKLEGSNDNNSWITLASIPTFSSDTTERTLTSSVFDYYQYHKITQYAYSTVAHPRCAEIQFFNDEKRYSSSGTYTSKVFDAEGYANWSNLDLNYELQTIESGEETLIDTSGYDYLGNMTYFGGLSKAFDGTTSQISTSSSASIHATTKGVIGIDWGAGNTKNITKVMIYGSSDYGFRYGSNTYVLTITIQGSNDNVSWTNLGSGTGTTSNKQMTISSLSSGYYRYHRAVISWTGTDQTEVLCAELQFYETGNYETDLSIQTRTSSDNSTWTSWTDYISGLIDDSARYFQYRVLFETENDTITSVLKEVSFDYQRIDCDIDCSSCTGENTICLVNGTCACLATHNDCNGDGTGSDADGCETEGECILGNDEYTVFLLQSETSDGNTTFVDTAFAGENIQLSRTGSIIHSTNRSKFGSSSMYFPGVSYLESLSSTLDEFNGFGKDDEFTVDFWVNFEEEPTHSNNFWCIGAVDVISVQFELDSSQRLRLIYHYLDGWSYGASNIFFSSALDWDADRWYHIALVKDISDTWYIFRDGELVYNTTMDYGYDFGQPAFYLGDTYAHDNFYIEEYRYSYDIARWTEDFTPPTKAYSSG